MKYYELNNEAYAYKVEGGVEITTPIFNGTVLPNHEALQYDEEGNITNSDVVELLKAKKLEQKLQEAKQQKLDDLASIVVTTTSGKTFDGRDIDQTRMMAAIQAADILGQTETEWKLADNSIVTVTVDEVKEALALAIQKTGEIIKG